MALTIRDCCRLPSLAMAEVIAGHKGLDRPVDSVSVLEWMDLKAFQTQYFLQNEIVITSFYTFRDDVPSQLLALRRLRESGETAMILYYVGLILPEVDPALIELADELEFPIIMMPRHQTNLRYAEAIREISEQIQRSRAYEPDFVHATLERLSQVPEIHRSVVTALRLLSDQMQATLVLCDSQFQEYLTAAWPRSLHIQVRRLLDAYLAEQPGMDGFEVRECIPVNNTRWHGAKLLVLAREGEPLHLSRERLGQVVTVLELTGKLWKNYEFDTYSADLLAAVINNDASETARLLKRRGADSLAYNTLWVLGLKDRSADYRERSLLLAEQLKALRTNLEARGIRGHAAILDDHIAVMARFEDGDRRDMLAELCMKAFFAAWVDKLSGITAFHEAFSDIIAGLAEAARVFPEGNPISQHELGFLKELRLASPERKAHREALTPLAKGGTRQEDLLLTLQAYFLDCGMNAECCAQKLFLHRNTVKYRLQKAEELLGYPLSHFPQTIALYRALALMRLEGG